MKRVWCILLTICMLIGAVTGCGGTDASKDSDNKLIVGVVQNANIDDYNDNAFTKYLEKELGIDIVFEFFSSNASEYMQQLALRASSNETLPDVIWGFHDMDTYTMNQYGEDGYFLDLTDLIEEHATNYKEQYEKLSKENKKRIDKGKSDDGAIYGMPLLSVAGIDDIQNQMYINQTWLDKLGLQAPTNIDELYTVLKAFKEQDPNGNEIDDEVPVLGSASGTTDITGYFINAFVYFNVTNRLHVENGKVGATFITDEYRQALVYMNKLCKEGLLSDFCFTITSNTERKSLITPSDGVAKVGIWCGNPELVADTANPILGEYTPLTYLADATGKGGYSVVRQPGLSFCSYITKDCDNPELAMKFLDIFYNDETVKRMRFGEKEVHWVDATGKDAFGNDVYMKVIDDTAFFKGNATWGRNGNSIMTPANYYRVANSGNAAQELVQKLAGETWKIHKASPEPEVVRDLVYTAEEYTEKNGYETLIADYVLEARGLFVVGTKDPANDTDWQEYVKTFDKLSLNRFLEIVQTAYDREFAK